MKRKIILILLGISAFFFTDTKAYCRDEGREHRGGYYEHYRRYPQEFYFYHKIYCYPEKRYYYFYDFYPDRIYYYETEKNTAPANPAYIPVTSIANMASQGVPDAVIISEIERTHSVYKLNSEIITYLKQNGAGDSLIDYMLETGKKRKP